MPCECQIKKEINPSIATDSDVISMPHSILPGQSCVFCAQKHIDTAMSALSLGDFSTALGDLELARRHTMIEYTDVGKAVAAVEYSMAVRKKDCAVALYGLLPVLDKHVAAALDSREEKNTKDAVPESMFALTTSVQANNPFVGEIHLCAAYRLAFEVGYMMQNKAMIIGDMTYATEHLVHHFYEAAENIRERRHYIQTTRASDISMYWPYLINKVREHIEHNLTAYTAEYADGLAKWLGIDNEQLSADK